jgi:hypothetical protein
MNADYGPAVVGVERQGMPSADSKEDVPLHLIVQAAFTYFSGHPRKLTSLSDFAGASRILISCGHHACKIKKHRSKNAAAFAA